MTIPDKIQQYVQKLPVAFQSEALDFVEYLLAKAERDTARQADAFWGDLSLTLAMRGMEHEDTPIYTASDLKVAF